jgi:ATP-dependent DNA helicase RecG
MNLLDPIYYECNTQTIWDYLDQDTVKAIADQNKVPTEYTSLLNMLIDCGAMTITDRTHQSKPESNKLFTEETYDITKLGMIMFGKKLADHPEFSQFPIRITIHKSSVSQSTDNTLSGQRSYINALALLDKIIEGLGKTFTLFQDIELGRKLLKPLLINAMMYQVYHEKKGGPELHVYPDRIEVQSHGLLLIEKDRYLRHPQVTRHPKVAELFCKLKLTSCTGTGLESVVRAIEAHQLPALSIISENNVTKVTIYNKKPLSDFTEEETIDAIVQHVYLCQLDKTFATNASVCTRLGTTDTERVRLKLEKAKRRGLIKTANSSKKYAQWVTEWYIIP